MQEKLTVLEPESLYPDTLLEQRVMGDSVRILQGNAKKALMELPDELCAQADGLMTLRLAVPKEALARFPKLKVVIRMGVGYDRVDRAYCAERGITVCNVPDYGTQEVADTAVTLAATLRRGIPLYHDAMRGASPCAWGVIPNKIVRRFEVQTFGVLGLGRIGTAAALRAKALGFRVVFYDPHLPNGADRAIGVTRLESLEALMEASDVLSIHTPLTRNTRGLVGAAELARLKEGAVVINTARGPILDLDALEAGLRSGRIAAAGLDVLPVEPPVPEPPLLQAYRASEAWLRGRLIILPHIAFHSPEAWDDIRLKSAETMRDVLVRGLRTNVIPPESD
ncbi:MAG: C-terminal binding protein [Roseococcus sp.]|nr:C-terminal binding protein [Roseococcus sp.]